MHFTRILFSRNIIKSNYSYGKFIRTQKEKKKVKEERMKAIKKFLNSTR